MVSAILQGMDKARQQSAVNLTIGRLQTKLAGYDEDRTVRVAGRYPWLSGRWGSYRGYYEDMALEPAEADAGENTVGALRATLADALGQTLYGYKGGEYTVTPDTLLWIAEWGDCVDSQIPVDLLEIEGVLCLVCVPNPVWREVRQDG